MQSFGDSVPFHKLQACCYDMQKFPETQAVLVVVLKTKVVGNSFKSQ